MKTITYIPSKEKVNFFFQNTFTYIASKIKILEKLIIGIIGISILLFLIVGVSFTTNYVIGATNVTNVTVLARVNITNTEPNITSVTVDDDVKVPPGEIDLIANSVKVVTCNATVFDYNGANDIINANNTNATFYIQSVGSNAANDNNNHYTNSSCGKCIQGPDANTAYCDCRFAVQYYANYSNSWVCNFTVTDAGGYQKPEYELNLTDSEVSSSVTVKEVLGMDTGTLLDYGNLSVTETSSEIIHNVTNVGNIDLNLSLRGWGGDNESEEIGQNVTMICEFGNITFDYQRYELGSDKVGTTVFDNMFNLTNQTVLTNFAIPPKINDTHYGQDRNSTIWRLQIPYSVGGLCNGTILFGAIDAS